jgi:hypothetical protein
MKRRVMIVALDDQANRLPTEPTSRPDSHIQTNLPRIALLAHPMHTSDIPECEYVGLTPEQDALAFAIYSR